MSNRIVAFLTLIFIFLLGSGLAWWYFTKGVSSIQIHISGAEKATATLIKWGSVMITSPCDAGECSLERVPPFRYTLRVSADGYLNYEESIEVKANTHIERSIALKKDIHLSEFRTEDTAGKVAEWRMKTTIEKSGGEVIGSYENSLFFIKKTGNTAYTLSKISLAFSGAQIDIRAAKTIQTLTSVDVPIILSFNSTDGLSGIGIGKDTILFDAKNESILSLNIPSQNQLKNISRYGDVFILSTDHGAIIARGDGKTSEHPLYDDIFVLPNGDLIALVRWESMSKKSLLPLVLKDQNESLVVLDKKSGGRTLLLESNESLDHFTQDEGKVLVVTSDDKKFVIENITK